MMSLNWTMVLTIINFLILMYILYVFLYKPLLEFLDKRAEKIRNDLETAEKSRIEAEELLKKREEQLREARLEAKKIIEDAEVKAREQAKKILEDAENLKSSILKEAEEQKEHIINEAKKELIKEVISLSTFIAEKLIKENLENINQEKIIKEYLEKWK